MLLVAAPPAVVLLVLGIGLGAPLVGLVLALVVGGLLAWWTRRSGPAVASQQLGASPADPVRDARLLNLVEGLSGAAGVPVPALAVLDVEAPNAASYGLAPRSATVVVTRGLLRQATRVELEGVLARELARIKQHEILPATVAVAVLRLVGSVAPLRARVVAQVAGSPVEADAGGVAITRYPPGLAGALGRIRAAGGAVPDAPCVAHLWLVPPAGLPVPYPPLEERIEALREL